MQRRILFSCLMLLVFSIVTKAQWEKLPLFGGHVERFIENKFNTNDVFALVKNYGVWYSSDAGENWRTTNGNNNELLNRTISDLEITNDGIIYIITEQTPLVSTILCSTDQGARWNEIQLPLKYNISPIRNNIEVNANGDIFLYAISTHGPDLDYLLKTTDFGTTWVEVTIPGFDNWLFTNFIIDKDNPNIIFIFGANGYYAVTNDGGNTWTTTTMFKKYNLRPPFRINYRSINTYGMFAILPGGVVYDYFESQDTGKTWIKKNINIIPQGNGDNIIVLENGTMLTQGVDSLMTSTDEGVSWHGHALRAIDIIKIGNNILGTFLIKGIQKSSDLGLTWNTISNAPDVCMFSNIKITTATDSVLYVAISDEADIYFYPLWQLRFSSDAGNTWKTLFESEDLGDLQVNVSDKIRYYCVVNKRNLITGVFDQAVPDTILRWTLTGNQFPGVEMYSFKKSYVQEGLLYLAANTGQGMKIFHSGNFGKDWESSDGAPFAFKYFHIFPSCRSPSTIVGVSELINDMDIIGRGYWISYDYGVHWTQLLNTTPKQVVSVFSNDIILDWTTFSHSSDYGQTWYINKDGIKDELKDKPFPSYTIGDKLFIIYDTSWYQYINDKWKSLPTISGKKLPRGSLQSLSYIGNTFYGGFQGNGLYRYRNVFITNVEDETTNKNDFYLSQNFPNPFKETTTFKFTLSTTTEAEIVITNYLGKIVRRFHVANDDSNERLLTWDGNDEHGIKLPSGTYLFSILSDRKINSRKVTLMK